MRWGRILFVVSLLYGSALAFSPETHIWVGEQVLADVKDDGKVTIHGQAYEVDPLIVQALNGHAPAYRAGHLGPDTFPDAVVGQTTTHPGLHDSGGWPTDEFLRHVLLRARESGDPQALAFAYGYLGHAAADIFAHTYVNRYAGDVFDLNDDATVELRHFALEKYIGQFTPAFPTSNADYAVPAAFVRDTLIKDDRIQEQYAIGGYAQHLVTAVTIQKKVRSIRQEAERVDQVLGEATQFFVGEVATGKNQLQIAQELLRRQESALAAAEDGVSWTKKQIEDTNEALKKLDDQYESNEQWLIDYPSLRILKQSELDKAHQAAKYLIDTQVKLETQVVNKYNELNSLPSQVVREVCVEVTKNIPIIGDLIKEIVCRSITVVADAYQGVLNEINNLKGQIITVKQQVEQANADIAFKTAELALLANEYATKTAFKTSYTTMRASLSATLTLNEQGLSNTQFALEKAREAANFARKKVAEAQAFIEQNTSFLDMIKDWVVRVRPISGLLISWETDIDRALSEYVKVGLSVGVGMVRRDGDLLSSYTQWLSCWGPVFLGVPGVVSQTACDVTAQVDTILQKLEDLKEGILLKIPGYAIISDLKKDIRAELLELRNEGVVSVVTMVSGDKNLGRFVNLLMKPGPLSDDTLVQAFTEQGPGTILLDLPDIVTRVQKDMVPQNGVFTAFAAAQNAVTLTKMALLDQEHLNALYARETGQTNPVFTSTGPYSVLLGMVRSIDGNHQWQAYGLPYPRIGPVAWGDQQTLEHVHFGYSAAESGGTPFWVNEAARTAFFGRVFTGPLTPGLDDHPSLATHPFPECSRNPYPVATIDGSSFNASDLTCTATVKAPLSDLFIPIRSMQVNGQVVIQNRSQAQFIWVSLVTIAVIAVSAFALRPLRWTYAIALLGIGLLLYLIGRYTSPLALSGLLLFLSALALLAFLALRLSWRLGRHFLSQRP